MLSASRFATAQIFTRETGGKEDRTRETATVFSAGMQPFKRPLSLAVVVPLTFVASQRSAGHQSGFEDAIVSLRYRAESERFTNALGLDESYFMGVGGLELPTGTLDHDFGRDGVNAIAAGLVSVAKRPFSVIGCGYYHHTRVYRGVRDSGNVFVGAGGAWTPVDDTQTGRLFSLQLGLSHEQTFAEEVNGQPAQNSGGSGIFAHEGFVWGANEHLQIIVFSSVFV